MRCFQCDDIDPTCASYRLNGRDIMLCDWCAPKCPCGAIATVCSELCVSCDAEAEREERKAA